MSFSLSDLKWYLNVFRDQVKSKTFQKLGNFKHDYVENFLQFQIIAALFQVKHRHNEDILWQLILLHIWCEVAQQSTNRGHSIFQCTSTTTNEVKYISGRFLIKSWPRLLRSHHEWRCWFAQTVTFSLKKGFSNNVRAFSLKYIILVSQMKLEFSAISPISSCWRPPNPSKGFATHLNKIKEFQGVFVIMIMLLSDAK